MIAVLGASGFIGSHLVEKLRELGIDYFAPRRDEKLSARNLGDVIYCIGLTSDFRSRPLDTVEAHVCKLLPILRDCVFDSLLYLSSTRVYQSQPNGKEDNPVLIEPLNSEHLYNASKVMGELVARASGKKIRIARISNVYGVDRESRNFLPSIVRDAVTKRKVSLQISLDSEKDYISITDACELLIKIARGGQETNYNVASGKNVSNRTLTQRLAELTGCEIAVSSNAPRIAFPTIDIERVKHEFDFVPANVIDDLETLVRTYQGEAEGLQ